MKLLTATALAALLAGSLGISALVPAYADDAATAPSTTAAPASPGPTQDAAPAGHMNWSKFARDRWDRAATGGSVRQGHGGWHGAHSGRMQAGLLNFGCGPRAGEALEIALVRAKYDVTPDAQQQPLFDALQTAAVAAQKSFSDTCKAAMDQGATPGKANVLDRLQAELAIDSAKVTALNAVVPKFKALYDSLTDEQKTRLDSQQRGDRMGRHMGAGGMGNGPMSHPWHRPGMMHPMPPGMQPQPAGDTSPTPTPPATDPTPAPATQG